MKRYTKIGLTLTVSWLLAALALVAFKFETLHKLSLNEWGDFLSGAMSPLALFWLVVGYFQQGEELRLNTEALKAQQEELGRQVQETALLAEHSARQAAAAEQLALATMSESQRAALKEKMEAMPVFRPAGGQGSGPNTILNIRNAGGTVTNLAVSCSNGASMNIKPSTVFESGTEGRLTVNNVASWPFPFTVTFTDKYENTCTKNYEMLTQFEFVERSGAQPGVKADRPKKLGPAA